MSTESKTKDVTPSPNTDAGGNVPSGFILKLFQMVNGAPDEVISVSSSSSSSRGKRVFDRKERKKYHHRSPMMEESFLQHV
jgi:hypothetical protein